METIKAEVGNQRRKKELNGHKILKAGSICVWGDKYFGDNVIQSIGYHCNQNRDGEVKAGENSFFKPIMFDVF